MFPGPAVPPWLPPWFPPWWSTPIPPSLLPNDIALFRSSAGPAVPAAPFLPRWATRSRVKRSHRPLPHSPLCYHARSHRSTLMAGCTQKRAYMSPQVPADGPVCTPRAAQSTCPLLPNDIGPFRSSAGYGGALPEGVGAEGLALARRAVACRQGTSAGTPLRGYPSHCASLVGPSL